MKFQIDNLSCANCKSKIEKGLEVIGYQSNVDLSTQTVEVFNATPDDSAKIISELKKLGYNGSTFGSQKKTIEIEGMSCVNCAGKIEAAITPYTKYRFVDFNQGKAYYLLLPGKNDNDVVEAISKIGYSVVVETEEKKKFDVKLLIGIIGATYFIAQMAFVHFIGLNVPYLSNPYVDFVVATLVQFTVARKYYISAISDLRLKTFGMDFLVMLSTTIAYVYSTYLLFFTDVDMLFFEIQVILLVTINIGNVIEERIRAQAKRDLNQLNSLQADIVHIVDEGEVTDLELEFVTVGSRILVKTGETVPLDGIIKHGQTTTDEALLTGEEDPIEKQVGSEVIAGTINLTAPIEVEVTQLFNSTKLSKIISQANQITSSKSNIEKSADKIVKYFVPTIILISIITFGVWYMTTGEMEQAVYVALSTLIIACPCALGLATPISFMIGNTKFAQNHILVQDLDKLLVANKLDAIAFDKTGTLIQKQVVDYKLYNRAGLDDVAAIKAIEAKSSHPLAVSIVNYLSDVKANLVEEEVEELIGIGITVGAYTIGSHKVLNEAGREQVEDINNVFVMKNGQLICEFIFEMVIDDQTVDFLNELSKTIDLYVITGDTEDNCRELANRINFKAIFASMTVEAKVEKIEEIQQSGARLMYIGDGVNDVLALTKADLSVAINGNVDSIKHICDAVLLDNDIKRIGSLIEIGTKIHRNVIQNYTWAFSYNLIAIPIAVAGLLNPIIAGMMMMFSSIFVIINATRLRHTIK